MTGKRFSRRAFCATATSLASLAWTTAARSGDRPPVTSPQATDGDGGIAIDIQGHTRGTRIIGNTLLEKRSPAKRIGVRIGEHVGSVELADNTIEGFATEVRDLRRS